MSICGCVYIDHINLNEYQRDVQSGRFILVLNPHKELIIFKSYPFDAEKTTWAV